jgi:eukaryotic-like serine/threonine-protein kinase
MTISCPSCFTDNPDGTLACIACGTMLESDDPNQSSPVSLLHLPAGTVLHNGKYRIDKTLGEGGFGITYKAANLLTGETIALKEFLPERSSRQGTVMCWSSAITPARQREELEKFKAEAESIHRCNHPNTVKVYDWFEANNTAYIAMDFVAGSPLSEVLKQAGQLPESQVKSYLQQIAEALRVVHTNQLLHR